MITRREPWLKDVSSGWSKVLDSVNEISNAKYSLVNCAAHTKCVQMNGKGWLAMFSTDGTHRRVGGVVQLRSSYLALLPNTKLDQ